jgi:2'-5' RNA ligase
LQAGVERALAPYAENPVPEPFLAHATLGRFQKYRRHITEKLVPRALSCGGRSFGDWQVETVGLFRSELSPAGARHTPVGVFKLGAA